MQHKMHLTNFYKKTFIYKAYVIKHKEKTRGKLSRLIPSTKPAFASQIFNHICRWLSKTFILHSVKDFQLLCLLKLFIKTLEMLFR